MVKEIEENVSISSHELNSPMAATIVGQRINIGKVKVTIPNTITSAGLIRIQKIEFGIFFQRWC